MQRYVHTQDGGPCYRPYIGPIQLGSTGWTLAKTSITFRLMSDVGVGSPISREPDRPNLQMFAYMHLPLFYRRTGKRFVTAGQAVSRALGPFGAARAALFRRLLEDTIVHEAYRFEGRS